MKLENAEPEDLFNRLLKDNILEVWMGPDEDAGLSIKIMVNDSSDYRYLSVPFSDLVDYRVSCLDDCLDAYAIPTKQMAEQLKMAAATLEYELKQRGVG